MKVIYLIRHAKSSWAVPGLPDFDRPLNDRGKRDAPFMAQLMAKRQTKVDVMVSSPALRARLTAKYFQEGMGLPGSALHFEPAIYEALPNDLLNLILNLDDRWSAVFLFGHNPGFTALANRFTTVNIDNVPTCGIVKVVGPQVHSWDQFTPSRARVADFIYPKQFL